MSPPVKSNEELKDTRPGCWDLAYVEWVRVACIFIVLWTSVGLFFWALLQIGLTIRGTQYLNMEQRFFGPFNRPLVPIVAKNSFGKEKLVNTFNRPAGCEGTFEEGYVCRPAVNPSWSLGSWYNTSTWTRIYTACESINEEFATLINPASKTGEGVFTGYCLNVLPINKFIPEVPLQQYPTYGL
uniref:Uncharacterized protein n=1 Tax=Tetraselmis sp. GSL018 TaxID=582737 RepID=A0A061S5S2_9CHLO|eukprot:CAMPEP_0177603064 /NCGR_PEP_ID=MMETSP0419_2-20121207/15279_1 /TAXON_ID=582737 /ORGANISM="Tetraselmis sp., Strain GSL018" /LENGTH=183 /DNA_ID=CAMNT_0019096743 /DNA_START=149 /DNA_END=700 /DNA_ORIENTATION=-